MSKIDDRFIKRKGSNALTIEDFDPDILLFDDFEELSADWKIYKNPAGATPTDGAEAVSSLTNTKSVIFDGVGDYGSVTKGADITTGITTAITVSLWCYANSDLSGILYTLMNHLQAVGDDRKWFLGVRNDANTNNVPAIQFNAYADGTNNNYITAFSDKELFPSRWYHIAATFDSGTIKIYVDGAETGYNTPASAGTTTSMADNNGPIEIGRYSGSAQFLWDGFIDEVSVWDAALTATEIAEIFNNGLPENLSTHSANANLVSWWRMGDGDTAPTITDQIGTNDCTLQNGMDASNIVSGGGAVEPSLTLVAETGVVLTGSAAARLTKPAINAQGEGVSRDFAVQKFYRGQDADIYIKYFTDTGYVASYYIVTFYDITNGAVVALQGVDTVAVSGTNGSWFKGTVTIPATCENMRVIVHSAATNTGAFDIVLDDVKIKAVLP